MSDPTVGKISISSSTGANFTGYSIAQPWGKGAALSGPTRPEEPLNKQQPPEVPHGETWSDLTDPLSIYSAQLTDSAQSESKWNGELVDRCQLVHQTFHLVSLSRLAHWFHNVSSDWSSPPPPHPSENVSPPEHTQFMDTGTLWDLSGPLTSNTTPPHFSPDQVLRQ